MARILIIGCGCRGRALGTALRADGHAVRGTTRSATMVAAIEAAGAEPHLGDPDRVATLARAFDHVSVAVLLLGSAVGTPEQVAALHGPRLDMLLARMLDTTVHGVVYEVAGSVAREILEAGAARVRAVCEDSLIPHVLLRADPTVTETWCDAARAAVSGLLAGV